MCVKDTTVCSCEKIHLHPSFRDGFLLMSRPYLTLWRGGFQPRISTYAMFVLIDWAWLNNVCLQVIRWPKAFASQVEASELKGLSNS